MSAPSHRKRPTVDRLQTPAHPVAPGEAHRGVAPLLGSAGISLLTHMLIIAVFAAFTWAVGSASQSVAPEFNAQVVMRPAQPGLGGGFHHPGRAYIDRPDSAKATHQAETISDLAALFQKQQDVTIAPQGSVSLTTLATPELRRSDVIGAGLGGGHGETGLGSGLGDREAAGGGPVGSLWGVGEGQTARSVVYVMDRSGSMSDTFHLLQRELMRAVGSLEREQRFNVIWFNEGKATELFNRLQPATLDAKREAFDAIKRIVCSGQTEPLDAIRRGLGLHPDVLFLLSDGDFGEDNKKIIQTIKQQNRRGATIINTILFVYDTMGDGERVLREIADENRGLYKHVTSEDIHP